MSLKKCLCCLLIALISWNSFSPDAIAQNFYLQGSISPFTEITVNHYVNLASLLDWIFGRRRESDDERPSRTESAGRRGRCGRVSRNFVGIVPPTERSSNSFLGYTTQEFPTLWVYISELPDDVKTMELMLQDEAHLDVLEQPVTLPLSSEPGIHGISFETAGIPLNLDQPYHWYLSIICDSARPSRNPSINAWVQRVSLTPATEQQLSLVANEIDQINVYIKDEIWHDALTKIIGLRCRFPTDEALRNDFKDLLSSANLDPDLANAPIVHCPPIE